jgi:hypothetical protein
VEAAPTARSSRHRAAAISRSRRSRRERIWRRLGGLAAHFGSVIDGDYRIEVIEQRADTITAVVPMPPEPGADPVVRLDEVSGRIYDMLHTSGIGGYLIPSDALMWVLRHSGPRGHRSCTGCRRRRAGRCGRIRVSEPCLPGFRSP